MPNANSSWSRTSTSYLVEDVHFIFGEVGRFLELEKQWLETKSAPPELSDGYLWELPHPTDRHRRFPCGRIGMARLEKLARLAAERAGITSQVSLLTVRTPLAKSLVRRFVLEGRAVDVSQIERALSEAARIAKRSLNTVTHFVPCHLMTVQAPDEFTIGPVRLLNQKTFRGLIANHLWRRRSEDRRNANFLADVTKYYKSFGWVAEVSIIECDEKTAERVATQAVTYALDCLQLFFGPSHTRVRTLACLVRMSRRRFGNS